MFGLGSTEIFIVALVLLFIFGGKKLTEWAHGLGETSKELKKAKREFSQAISETETDIKDTLDFSKEEKALKK